MQAAGKRVRWEHDGEEWSNGRVCEGGDSNPRTPARMDPKSIAFGRSATLALLILGSLGRKNSWHAARVGNYGDVLRVCFSLIIHRIWKSIERSPVLSFFYRKNIILRNYYIRGD